MGCFATALHLPQLCEPVWTHRDSDPTQCFHLPTPAGCGRREEKQTSLWDPTQLGRDGPRWRFQGGLIMQREAAFLVFFKPLNTAHVKALILFFLVEAPEFCIASHETSKVTDFEKRNYHINETFYLYFPATDSLYKLSLQTLNADIFLKQRQTSPTPASPSPPAAPCLLTSRSSYSSIVNSSSSR